jgi:hypothetical protein
MASVASPRGLNLRIDVFELQSLLRVRPPRSTRRLEHLAHVCNFAACANPAISSRQVLDHRRAEDHRRIERLVAGPYLELFARETKPGWECWGDEAGLFDNGPVVTRRQPSRLVEVRPGLKAAHGASRDVENRVGAKCPSPRGTFRDGHP